jgi:ferredoxin
MGTIRRRDFIRTAALACPFLAVGGGTLLRAQQQKKSDEDDLMVVKLRCTGCGDCVKVCPVDAITMKNGLAVIDVKECIDCGECETECPAEAIMRKKEYDKAGGDKKGEDKKPAPDKPDDRPSLFDPKLDNSGVWIMTGTFADGSTTSEQVRFVGTAVSGVIKSAQSDEDQGSYKITGTEVEIRLPEGQIAKGRLINGTRLEGSLPGNNGTWRAEKKK